eukprot:CAMPEP_0198139540 /NCGR_PEP_ID=MMETSP1443-20131203/2824_1 /TAXON_ID=186043 /ORGANISM="Entomoneis sp., Strain CCMP2396" /LENGTH=297 /DNA_ID=CAMNT_0043801693 /DNA_START=15 /DNA_END=908 /DNA_ORIENTATION=-
MTAPEQKNNAGGYGGYPWGGFGVMRHAVGTYGASGSTRLRATLRILQSDSSSHNDQFYLPEMGGCWKLDGSPCDGEITTSWPKQDVTRYICFIIAPLESEHCGPSPENQKNCPPYHIFSPQSSSDPKNAGVKVYRNDTRRFPYMCYHLHCYAPNDVNAPVGETCDPYSNPNPQELMQLKPCKEWGIHGFPTKPGDGWTNATQQTWDLDVGGLGARLFFQGKDPKAVNPDTGGQTFMSHHEDVKSIPQGYSIYPGLKRTWLSFEIGAEQMFANGGPLVRWELEDWDVLIPTSAETAFG